MAAPTESTAQASSRKTGDRHCRIHRGREFIFFCSVCKELVCQKCVTSLHKGHNLEDLDEVVKDKMTDIQQALNIRESHILPKNEKEMKEIVDMHKENEKFYQDLVKRIQARRDQIKVQADKQSEILLEKCSKMKLQNKSKIEKYESDLKTQQDTCKQTIRNYKHALQSEDSVKIYDANVCKSWLERCSTYPVHLMKYLPPDDFSTFMSKAFGDLGDLHTGMSDIRHGEEFCVKGIPINKIKFLISSEVVKNDFQGLMSKTNGKVVWSNDPNGPEIKMICCLEEVTPLWIRETEKIIDKFFCNMILTEVNIPQAQFEDFLEKLRTINVSDPDHVGVVVERDKQQIIIVGYPSYVEDLTRVVTDLLKQ